MSYHVLIVDDSRLARMSVINKLAILQPSWTYTEAKDADEALIRATQGSFALALLDFGMPGSMDGLQLAARLKSTRKDLTVAIISANAQNEIVSGARALDVEFLPKPLQAESFKAFLDRVIASRGAMTGGSSPKSATKASAAAVPFCG